MIISEEFSNAYNHLYSRYSRQSVFYDFVKMCAISMYNSFAKNEQMEKEYLNTIKKYKKDDQNLFPKMFCELVIAYEKASHTGITDILGPIYEAERLADGHIGQVFTPSHISDLIAKIVASDKDRIQEQIENNGYISLCEPACGAGRHDYPFCKSFAKSRN